MLQRAVLDILSVFVLQELYQAVPVALAPVLGNPILLAAFGVDRKAPLQDQVPGLFLFTDPEMIVILINIVGAMSSLIQCRL